MKSFTCFKLSLEELRKKINLVLSSSPPMHFDIETVEKVEIPVLEYKPERRLFLLWEPRCNNGSTVFSPNIEDGWHTLVNILSTKHLCDSYSVRLSPEYDDYPICELSTHENGTQRRFIRAMKDDPKWQFVDLQKQTA